MLFNSIEFVIFFTVVCSSLVLFKFRQFPIILLLFSSYFFFYFTSNYLIILLLFTTVWNYYLAQIIWKTKDSVKKKYLLGLNLAGSLGVLGLFKYFDFGIEQLNNLALYFGISEIPYLNLLLPIGISFYTFQALSYTIDIYRGKLTPSKSFIEFAFFVSFFPQLVAGPILRASNFLPQLREKMDIGISGIKLKQHLIHHANLKIGITMMAFGFMKKMFFADNIAPMVNEVFNFPIGYDSLVIITTTIAFGIQIYADFSGYSDIAIGAALILGFKVPLNFNKPYFATSPSDFWQRWHISLSTWLRDYLYIPLGGNRKSLGRTYTNLITVMFLGGLWHGASWNFVIWGLLHGGYLAIHKVITDKFPGIKIHPFFRTKTGKIVSILVTQYFVFLAWIPFRITDLNHMFYAMEKYVILDFDISEAIIFFSSHKLPLALMLIFMILQFISYKKPNLLEKASKLSLKHWMILLFTIAVSIVFFYSGTPADFIYFRF